MKNTTVPTELDQQHCALTPFSKNMEVPFGLFQGMTMPEGCIALMLLKQTYGLRMEIIEKFILNLDRLDYDTALETAQALVLTEKMLLRNGIKTERDILDKAGKSGDRTIVEDLLHALGDSEATNTFSSDVNRIFRPWIKQPKSADAR